MWTDSQIALYWIYQQHNSKLFISHSATEIVEAFPANLCSFAPSTDNPADLFTSRISEEQVLSSQLWQQRPKWLQYSNEWPQWESTNALLQLVEGDEDDCRSMTL